MKIAFISGVKFGHDLLQSILENGWNVSLVFSYDDSKKIFYSDFISFDEITSKYGIKHFKVNSINEPQNVEQLRNTRPDIILVMGWSQIIGAEILKIPTIGTIGSHPTMLPKYRGRAPIPWSIIKGLKESALTFFYMQEGVDDGDILDQRRFQILPDDDATSIYEKITLIGKTMLLENLSPLKNGKAKRIKQDNSQFIEYWPKRSPEDGKIDWGKSAREIHTLIRATTHPYPGAFSFFKKSKLKIWKAEFLEENSSGAGKIIEVSKQGVKIGTGQGTLIIQKVSLDDGDDVFANNIFSENDTGIFLGQ